MNPLAAALRRRTFLSAGGAMAGAALLPPRLLAAAPGATLVYDPAIPRACALAQPSAHAVPLRGDRVRFWRDMPAGPVSGFTSWSDFVLLGGLAAERGLRVRAMSDLSESVRGTLIAWSAA